MSPSQLQNKKQTCRWLPFKTAQEIELAAVSKILQLARESISTRDAFHFVLAGGTTPRKVYEALCEANADWQHWHIYFGDERCLPRDHADRNSRMAEIAWLDHVAIPPNQIHVIPAELGPIDAAKQYATCVQDIPLFDLVLLGLGEDGHTASLFPQQDAGESNEAPSAIAVFDAPKPPPQRVSLSARRLSNARQVIFLVTGMGKKNAVKNWRSGISIPAVKITPTDGVDIYVESALLD